MKFKEFGPRRHVPHTPRLDLDMLRSECSIISFLMLVSCMIYVSLVVYMVAALELTCMRTVPLRSSNTICQKTVRKPHR